MYSYLGPVRAKLWQPESPMPTHSHACVPLTEAASEAASCRRRTRLYVCGAPRTPVRRLRDAVNRDSAKQPVIPHRQGATCLGPHTEKDRKRYKIRSAIECFFGRIKENKRLPCVLINGMSPFSLSLPSPAFRSLNYFVNSAVAQGIKSLTATEWDALITRQETRRTTDNITEKSGDLQFHGTVHINTGENFKLNVDLYHNGQTGASAGVDINAIPDILLKTTKAFNDAFGIRKLDDATDFRVFIFNSKEDYLKYNPQPRGHATASDNGNVSSIYLFQGENNYSNSDPNDLLSHEFSHALTFQATAKLPIARTFMEGMAEYVVHKVKGENNADFINKIPAENFDRSIKEIIQNPLHENDHYETGAAIVAFLEETQPNFLDNLLYAARDARQSDKQINMQEMMDKFFQEQADKPLSDIPWFRKNMTDAKKQALENGTDKATSHTHHAHEHSQGAQGKPGVDSKSQEESDTAQHTTQQAENSQPIKVDYFDIEKLYQSLSGDAQQSALGLWNKLHANHYQVDSGIKNSLNAIEAEYLNLLQSQHENDQSFDSEPAVIVNMNMF